MAGIRGLLSMTDVEGGGGEADQRKGAKLGISLRQAYLHIFISIIPKGAFKNVCQGRTQDSKKGVAGAKCTNLYG